MTGGGEDEAVSNFMAGLTLIRETLEANLLPGERIADIVFRDVDCGIFGGQGFTFVLRRGRKKVRGFRIRGWQVTEADVLAALREIRGARSRKKGRGEP